MVFVIRPEKNITISQRINGNLVMFFKDNIRFYNTDNGHSLKSRMTYRSILFRNVKTV